MTILFVLLGISVVAFIAATVLNKLDEKWSQLPHFVYCHVGGVWAVCSISDFKKTAPESMTTNWAGETKTFRCVPETLAFGNAANTKGAKQSCFSGSGKRLDLIPWGGEGPFHPAEQSTELFVPFCSEKYGTFIQQEDFFTAPQTPEEFSRKKRRENNKDDFRLRFAAWTRHRNTITWKEWSLRALIIIAFITLITYLLTQPARA